MAFFNINLFGNRAAKLAAQAPTKDKAKRVLPYAPKSISRTRQDMATFNSVNQMAMSEEPKNYGLQLLLNDIRIDALLSSQVENRKQQVLGRKFTLKKENGEIDEEQTAMLTNAPFVRSINSSILDKEYYGYSLIELSLKLTANGQPTIEVLDLPRTNIVPQLGLFYPDYTEDKAIKYREMAEYGTYILEFDSKGFGLLHKAVPQVLFKRFAQSCWSELCEIYGIPPRVMKTNTQDPSQLARAEQMMKDMGAAAWFIIDESESFEWAQGVATNGDVYRNLINLCNNELSLLISGAVIGQDTVNGNRSKDESAQEMLGILSQSDVSEVELAWNSTVIPALVKLGILKGNVRLEFDPNEDIAQLWAMTKDALPYMTIDTEWIKKKFTLEVTGERNYNAPTNTDPTKGSKLSIDSLFFP